MAANPLPLVALPGDDLVWNASITMSNEDAAYPATNVQNSDPADVAKSTTNSTTFTVGAAGGAPVVAVGIINSNATTVTVNGTPVTIPALDADGQRVHGWLDARLAPIAGTGSGSWAVALSVASGVVWVGRIVLVTAIYEMPLKYGLQLGKLRPGDIEMTTRGGSKIRHGFQVRTRTAQGMVDLEPFETVMRGLEESSKGSLLPFLFIPDEATNDAWFVTFRSNDFAVTYANYDVREIAVAFEELSGGPPNG